MTTLVQSFSTSTVVPAFVALFLGVGIVAVAGHVQAGVLHDAAHDVRHANGFPCH